MVSSEGLVSGLQGTFFLCPHMVSGLGSSLEPLLKEH